MCNGVVNILLAGPQKRGKDMTEAIKSLKEGKSEFILESHAGPKSE
jgi:hypothetical protein